MGRVYTKNAQMRDACGGRGRRPACGDATPERDVGRLLRASGIPSAARSPSGLLGQRYGAPPRQRSYWNTKPRSATPQMGMLAAALDTRPQAPLARARFGCAETPLKALLVRARFRANQEGRGLAGDLLCRAAWHRRMTTTCAALHAQRRSANEGPRLRGSARGGEHSPRLRILPCCGPLHCARAEARRCAGHPAKPLRGPCGTYSEVPV